jgi:phosphate acyltransferase
MKIVVDMMGADEGSKITIEGVQLFLKRNPDANIIAVGRIEELTSLQEQCQLIDARDIVKMEAGVMDVLRLKDSSMNVAINTYLDTNADAIVSSGSTGGFLSATTLKLKLIKGVSRAALMSPFPSSVEGKSVTVLDIGANIENNAEQIVQFAHMGRIYSQHIFNVKQPHVYLLSNGSEDKKGTPELQEAFKLLKERQFPNFMGNIEAREALQGKVDVLVSGGFAGNIFLKATEGVFVIMSNMIKQAFKRNVFSNIGYLLSKKGFDQIRDKMNYKKYGGAMLLGVNGVVVKAHGSSDGFAFSYALEVAYKMAKAGIVKKIEQGLNQTND